MSKGNVPNFDAEIANGLSFGSTVVPTGTGTLTPGNVLTYSGGQLVLSPPGAGAPDPLSTVLATGNTTGANNIVVSSGQQVTFAAGAGIRMGVNGTTVPAPASDAVALGNASTTATAASSVAVGAGAVASQIGNVAVGSLASVNNINSVAMGFNAQGTGAQTVVIGSNANAGSGLANTVVGAASVATTTCTGTTIVGQGDTAAAGCIQTILVGAGISTAGTATTNMTAIGTQGSVQSNNSVKIGRGTMGTGGFNTAVGDFVTFNGTAGSTVAVGQNITIPTTTLSNTFIGTAPTIGGIPSNAVAVGAQTNVDATQVTVVGSLAQGRSPGVVSIGYGANTGATGGSGVAVGNQANSGTGARNTVCGTLSTHSTTTDSTIVGYGSTTIGSGIRNTICGANSSITNASATGCIILGQGSSITGAFPRCIILGDGVTNGAADSVFLPTTWAASAAGTAVSFDAGTGRLHPNTSSIRYKRDVKPLEGTSRVLDIEPVSYAFQKGRCGCHDECECGKREVGAIAEQVYEVCPEVVVMSKDPATGLPRPESIQYERLCVFLIAELKKQQYALVNHAKRLKLIEDYLSSLPDPPVEGVTNQDQTL